MFLLYLLTLHSFHRWTNFIYQELCHLRVIFFQFLQNHYSFSLKILWNILAFFFFLILNSSRFATDFLCRLFELANSLRCDSSHYTPRAYADGLSNSEAPIFFLSKTYFDTHEFKRCAHALRNCTSQPALFLRLYALYLAGESKKEEKHPNVLGKRCCNSSSQQSLRFPSFFSAHRVFLISNSFIPS